MTPAPVLALDLASVSGWAVGEPGSVPAHGSHRFASQGASHEAIFASAVRWINETITTYEPGIIVWEAPLPTSFNRGNTTSNTTTLLYGLPAVIGAVAYLRGIYDIRKAETRDVRLHFIGGNSKLDLHQPADRRGDRYSFAARHLALPGWNRPSVSTRIIRCRHDGFLPTSPRKLANDCQRRHSLPRFLSASHVSKVGVSHPRPHPATINGRFWLSAGTAMSGPSSDVAWQSGGC